MGYRLACIEVLIIRTYLLSHASPSLPRCAVRRLSQFVTANRVLPNAVKSIFMRDINIMSMRKTSLISTRSLIHPGSSLHAAERLQVRDAHIPLQLVPVGQPVTPFLYDAQPMCRCTTHVLTGFHSPVHHTCHPTGTMTKNTTMKTSDRCVFARSQIACALPQPTHARCDMTTKASVHR